MTPNQLKQVKRSLRDFYLLLDEYVKYSRKSGAFKHYNVLRTLVQNMQFDGSDCGGYNHEDAVKKLYQLEKLIESFKTVYPQDDVVLWIIDEVVTAVQYADMFEDITDIPF
jgi:hypothetical protein